MQLESKRKTTDTPQIIKLISAVAGREMGSGIGEKTGYEVIYKIYWPLGHVRWHTSAISDDEGWGVCITSRAITTTAPLMSSSRVIPKFSRPLLNISPSLTNFPPTYNHNPPPRPLHSSRRLSGETGKRVGREGNCCRLPRIGGSNNQQEQTEQQWGEVDMTRETISRYIMFTSHVMANDCAPTVIKTGRKYW